MTEQKNAPKESKAKEATDNAQRSVKKADTKASNYSPRMKALYRDKLRPELMKELGIKNLHDAPKLTKIVVSSGVGRNKEDKRFQETVANTLARVTGQRPVQRLAKKSIAGFKIRKKMGAPIGVMVTLRGDQMYEFLDRLINVAMPRIRDFRGASARAFDNQGNYNFGIIEQSIFPELTFEETAVLHGLGVTFIIDNRDVSHSRALLEKFGIPFEKTGKEVK